MPLSCQVHLSSTWAKGTSIRGRVTASIIVPGLRPKRTLRLVLWTAEEQGGVGAFQYYLLHQVGAWGQVRSPGRDADLPGHREPKCGLHPPGHGVTGRSVLSEGSESGSVHPLCPRLGELSMATAPEGDPAVGSAL